MSPNNSKYLQTSHRIYICHKISPKNLIGYICDHRAVGAVMMDPNLIDEGHLLPQRWIYLYVTKYLHISYWIYIYVTKYLQYSIWNNGIGVAKEISNIQLTRAPRKCKTIQKDEWSTERSFNLMSCWQRRKTLEHSHFYQPQVD